MKVSISEELKNNYIIAGTGHRPERLNLDYSPKSNEKLTLFAKSILEIMEGDFVVISGMAQGWDQALAHATIMLNKKLICAIPFDGQEAKWPDSAKARYNSILNRAHKVEIVCPGTYSAYKFIERDKWMVDRADLLLALWDKQKGGGTWETVNYAEKKGLPVGNCWENWMKLEQAA